MTVIDERVFAAFPELETERLRLGPMAESDGDDLFRLFSSDEWLRFIPRQGLVDPAAGVDKARTKLAAFAQRTAIWWAFRLRSSGELVGYGGLFDISREDHRAEIGYGLCPGHWGLGFATEAVAPLVDFGFGALGLHRIYGLVDPGNGASCRVLAKLGFELEGTLREAVHARGRYWDQCLYARLSPAEPSR